MENIQVDRDAFDFYFLVQNSFPSYEEHRARTLDCIYIKKLYPVEVENHRTVKLLSWTSSSLSPPKESKLDKVESSLEQECDPSSAFLDDSEGSPVSTSVQSLERGLRLSSALSRIERDGSQQSQSHGEGQTVRIVLQRQLSAILNEVELIPNPERVSVIARTPSRSPRTSTPSNSPPPPPIPPRTCDNPGPDQHSKSRSCSPQCSELSSISESVFIDTENPEPENVKPVTPQIKPPLSLAHTAPGAPLSPPLIVITGTMEEAENVIAEKSEDLSRLMRYRHVGYINEETLPDYKEDLKSIEDKALEIEKLMEALLRDFGANLTSNQKDSWKTQVGVVGSTFSNYRQAITDKAAQVRRSLGASNNGRNEEQLDLLRRQTEAQEKLLQASISERTDKLNESSRVFEEKKVAAIATAKVKYDTIVTDTGALADKVNKVPDWTEESELEVGRAMRSIKPWKEDLEKIVALHRSLKEVILSNGISESEVSLTAAEALVETVTDELITAVEAIEHEDNVRALFTLDTTKPDPVKLPTFEGRDEEDFTVFREKVEKAFIQNRTTKSDQLSKLREVLRGNAKKLVPESMIKTIDEAWADLEKAFGDVERVMNYRKQALMKLGNLPQHNSKGGYKAQVEWYLQLEVILRGLQELGRKDPKMAMEAFSPSTMKVIFRLFPHNLQVRLTECSGWGEAQLEGILDMIIKFRSKSQDLQKVNEDPSTGAAGGSGGGAGGKGGGGSGNGAGNGKGKMSGATVSTVEMQSLSVYKPPRRDEKCRICTTLEAEGDTENLYDNHLSNFPTGCPRYIGMQVEKRFKFAVKAKLCLKCHDPEYIYKPKDPRNKQQDPNHKCFVNANKKSRYTCADKSARCLWHMWVCCRHKEENKPGLEKFKEEINRKFSLEFVYVATRPEVSFVDSKKTPANADVDESEVSADVQPKASAEPISNVAKTSQIKEVVVDLTNSPDVVNSVAKSNHKSLSSEQALKKLKKKLDSQGEQVELRPIPKGRAQFMIGHTKGKTRPLLNLFDTGCGGLLLKEGVPQFELAPAVLKTKGPYIVKGVGDTTVKVNDEWMCSMSLRDGSRQSFEGWTVDKITATMPMIDVSHAEAELKVDGKENTQLQNLKVEPIIGGDVDILTGIMYSSIFPVSIHSLPSGLAIYELILTPHDQKFNSVIGGPHESFQYLAEQTGSMNIVFSNLLRQLENYKEFGPPKLSNSIMSLEDLEFAQQNKEWEMENITKRSLEHVDLDKVPDLADDYDDQSNELMTELYCKGVKRPKVTMPKSSSQKKDLPKKTTQVKEDSGSSESEVARDHNTTDEFSEEFVCSMCGQNLTEEKVSPADTLIAWASALQARADEDDENLQALRRLHKAQQEGFQIEYRCPRCRNCSDCRRSFETERVSLREEAEDLMIWDSVVIDWENKRIISYLPLRGNEEEFLSSNREIALKVLDQQCFKYFKDDETRVVIVKAFDKLIRNNQIVLWKNLTDDQKKNIEKKAVQHYIPWRVVFKPSISTPARPVMDASTNTKRREDGSAGRCLNDMVVKGRVVTLNLLKMLLRFGVGEAAVQGDLKQFYASIKLVEDQWNLQRILYRENLDPKNEVLEAVIKTLIWGVKSVSAQSEAAIIKLAQFVLNTNPGLADFLLNCRFVDDIGGSAKNLEILKKLTKDADDLFEGVGLSCKGWSYSGSDPSPEVSDDGLTVSIGGMKWHCKLDLLEIPFPTLHFSKKLRGRLVIGTKVFEGRCLEDMDKFVPRKLSRRMVFSKNASIFDLLGKFAPILAEFKIDLRAAVKLTNGWDDAVPEEVRSKWVKNLWRLETLRGLKFQRARMPDNAASTEMDLIVAVDAAQHIKMVGAWARFRLTTGDFSCQLVIGRSLLAEEDASIPKNELEALTMGSNLGWILRQSLESWVSSYILIGDSTIALCWLTSEKKRLSLFHRNRCVQIRRGTELNFVYHVISECNPSDLGTRPGLVQDSDVGPNSKWEKGLPWMNGDVDDAIAQGILTPAANLRLNDEDEESFKKGIVFEKSPEILTRGHIAVLVNTRVEKVKERSQFSDYPLSPTKYKFESIVRIYAIVRKFLKSFKCLKNRIEKNEVKFHMFQVTLGEDSQQQSLVNDMSLAEELTNGEFANQSFGVKKPGMQFKGKNHVDLDKQDISWALEFLFKKGSEEVKKFNKADFIAKIAVEKDGILFCKTRILDCQRFQVAGGLEDHDIFAELGIKVVTPVLDRYSPLSYSIAGYVHRKLAKHKGYENCLRESLNHCFIVQGMSLFKELGDDCVFCAKKRKKYIEASMGPVSDEQLTIAPAFWVSMVDIYGPCHIYVPGHSMKTRSRNVVEAKCYVLVFACPVTKLVNLQVIESKSAEGVIDGITRLSCEIGVPSFVLADQDSGIIKALKEADVNIRDLQFVLHKEKGIEFKTCPVSGHNYHGLVERKIRTLQECLDKCDVSTMRLHATGLQTLCKLVENDMNNLPLGFSFGRDSDNSPLLKLVFPNMLRTGRINSRALEGPIRLPKGPNEMMEKVERAYDVFFKFWNVTVIPKLMRLNKWFDAKSQLQMGDIVWFQKDENEFSSRWTVGKVTEIVKSKDGIVRRAQVQYQNATEDAPRTTDRAARSLIKLFHIDDQDWQSDMGEVERLLFDLKNEERNVDPSYTMSHTGTGLRYRLVANSGHDLPQREVGVQHRAAARVARSKLLKPCKDCCCSSHCQLTGHSRDDKTLDVLVNYQVDSFADLLDRSWVDTEYYEEELADMYGDDNDDFMALLCSVDTDLGGVDDEISCSTTHLA